MTSQPRQQPSEPQPVACGSEVVLPPVAGRRPPRSEAQTLAAPSPRLRSRPSSALPVSPLACLSRRAAVAVAAAWSLRPLPLRPRRRQSNWVAGPLLTTLVERPGMTPASAVCLRAASAGPAPVPPPPPQFSALCPSGSRRSASHSCAAPAAHAGRIPRRKQVSPSLSAPYHAARAPAESAPPRRAH